MMRMPSVKIIHLHSFICMVFLVHRIVIVCLRHTTWRDLKISALMQVLIKTKVNDSLSFVENWIRGLINRINSSLASPHTKRGILFYIHFARSYETTEDQASITRYSKQRVHGTYNSSGQQTMVIIWWITLGHVSATCVRAGKIKEDQHKVLAYNFSGKETTNRSTASSKNNHLLFIRKT